MAQHARAHHGGQRQRNDRRDDDGDRQRQRELAEHAPHEAGHEQQRDEDGDQRQGERDHREADLARALERRLHRALALLHVAHDVLDHDDGIVDDEAGADGQRHQRQVVEREAAEPHDAEGGHQRDGQRHAGDDGGADGAQEQQHHQHHQPHAQHQRELHVVHGGADGAGAIVHDGQLGVARHGPLQTRQLRPDALDRVDDVGAGLAMHVDDDGWGALVPAADLGVLQAVDDLRPRP